MHAPLRTAVWATALIGSACNPYATPEYYCEDAPPAPQLGAIALSISPDTVDVSAGPDSVLVAYDGAGTVSHIVAGSPGHIHSTGGGGADPWLVVQEGSEPGTWALRSVVIGYGMQECFGGTLGYQNNPLSVTWMGDELELAGKEVHFEVLNSNWVE